MTKISQCVTPPTCSIWQLNCSVERFEGILFYFVHIPSFLTQHGQDNFPRKPSNGSYRNRKSYHRGIAREFASLKAPFQRLKLNKTVFVNCLNKISQNNKHIYFYLSSFEQIICHLDRNVRSLLHPWEATTRHNRKKNPKGSSPQGKELCQWLAVFMLETVKPSRRLLRLRR